MSRNDWIRVYAKDKKTKQTRFETVIVAVAIPMILPVWPLHPG